MIDMLAALGPRLAIAAAVAAAFMVSGTANADWQRTKWGMTPEQVTAAHKPRPIPTTESERVARGAGQTLLKSTVVVARIEMPTFFIFDNRRRLSGVALEGLAVEKCLPIETALKEEYGRPSNLEGTRQERRYLWRDQRKGNLVSYFIGAGGSYCVLGYKALRGASSGL